PKATRAASPRASTNSILIRETNSSPFICWARTRGHSLPRPATELHSADRQELHPLPRSGRSSSTRNRSRRRLLILARAARGDPMSLAHRLREVPHEFNEKFPDGAQGTPLERGNDYWPWLNG